MYYDVFDSGKLYREFQKFQNEMLKLELEQVKLRPETQGYQPYGILPYSFSSFRGVSLLHIKIVKKVFFATCTMLH